MPMSIMATAGHEKRPQSRRPRYNAPDVMHEMPLAHLLSRVGRLPLDLHQMELLSSGKSARVFYAGELSLLDAPSVSIVGTRDVSEAGRRRASRLARELAEAGVTVVSGLAKGVATASHESAIEARGATVAVIGTPLNKAYPAENAALQEEIYRNHLLITPFAPTDPVFKGNFPARNKVMAAISDATVIIEASDTSGTLHQAAECQRLGRWLFILRSVVETPSVSWPSRFLRGEKALVIDTTDDIISRIS